MSSSIFNIRHHTIEAAHIREFARATSHSQSETLLQHVNQYTPKDNPNPQRGDITIIGAHANGLPKELYEPLWEELYHQARKNGLRIRDIYIADAAWQGKSGIINKNKLGNDPSWLDYSRDIVQMINTFRPPTPLIGMGHSFGGAAIVNAALYSPRLFTTIVLLDPVISRYSSVPDPSIPGPAKMSIRRRETWPSREVAAQSFARSAFYRSWDKRALDRWLQYGLVETPEGNVTLATTKHQEVFTYLRPSWDAFDSEGKTVINRELVPDIQVQFIDGVNLVYPHYRPEPPAILLRLPHVRPSTLYIFGGDSDLSPANLRDEKVRITGTGVGGSGGAAEGRVKSAVGDYGHMIPLEGPQYCAEHAAAWIKADIDRWWTAEREYLEWTKKTQEEKSTASDDMKRHLAIPEKTPAKPKAKI